LDKIGSSESPAEGNPPEDSLTDLLPDSDENLWVWFLPDQSKAPPDSPDDDDNGHGGHSGFAPPEAPAIPPAIPSGNRIYTYKFNLNETLNRMTERLPDGSIKLAWQDKTETVAPDDLAGWQPIETIPDVSLPNIESVEIPPVVVIDLETTDLDPKHGRILAAGLALYVAGKEVEVQIFRNEGD
jgi:hypothetical protein